MVAIDAAYRPHGCTPVQGSLDSLAVMGHPDSVSIPPSDDYLPCNPHAPAPRPQRVQAHGDASSSSARRQSINQIVILVVDDAPIIRTLVIGHLQQRGFLALPAGDGQEALGVLANRRVDLLITDLDMPQLDGHALLEAVQDQYPLMRRVVMTGYTTIENALDALKLGATGFVPKPIDLAVLDQVVDLAVAEMRGWMRQLAAIRKLRHGEG